MLCPEGEVLPISFRLGDVLCIEDPLFGESVVMELDVLEDFGVRLTFDCVGEEIDFEVASFAGKNVKVLISNEGIIRLTADFHASEQLGKY